MEPLIELSELAMARIKAKEANAAEQFDLVRRACADDEEVARRTWGGFLGLHTDTLQGEIERARRPLTEASGICAQYLFLAHAVEYHSAVPNPRELEPVLARLREDVIAAYGEPVRLGIERLGADEIAKASADERVGAHNSVPFQVGQASNIDSLSTNERHTVPAQHGEWADRQRKTPHATKYEPLTVLAPPRDFVPASTRAIVMHRFGSAKVAHIKVPKMAYAFRTDFPHIAQRSFLAKRLSAERMLEERKASIEDFQEAEALLLDFVLLLLVAFAEAAYSVGMQGKLSAAELESECLKFLRSYVLEAGFMDSSFGRASDYTPIPDSLQARIESSDQWGKYRELLQALADVQANELFLWATISGDFPEAMAAQTGDVEHTVAVPDVPRADDAMPAHPPSDLPSDAPANESDKLGSDTYDPNWRLRGDSDTLSKRREPFNRLARRAVIALGQKFTNRDEAVDAWLSSLHKFHSEHKTQYARARWRIRQVSEASAEYCAELSTRHHEDGKADSERKFAELERQFRELSDSREEFLAIRRKDTWLHRDHYPFERWLYDHAHESLPSLKMELDYWKTHVWEGYRLQIGHWERLDRRGPAWLAVPEDLKWVTVGLSYDLAVLQANYAIDRGLRGDEAKQVFQDETGDISRQVTDAWRAGCARLAILIDEGAEEIKLLDQAFHRVRDDLRRLLHSLSPVASSQLEPEPDSGDPANIDLTARIAVTTATEMVDHTRPVPDRTQPATTVGNTSGVRPEWASDLDTPEGRKTARDGWKHHWATEERECTNDDLTETAFSQKDRAFLNQWENGNTRLKDPSRSGRVQAIERVLRNNIPPKWHLASNQTRT